MPSTGDRLSRKAEDFADDLTTTIRDVLGPGKPAFQAVYEKSRSGLVRLVVRPQTPKGEPSPAIPILIGGTHRMDLRVEFRCTWDRDSSYLAVEQSKIEIRVAGDVEPLFRWEYVRAPDGSIPTSHFHVHAHRDELVYMLLTSSGSRRVNRRAGQLVSDKPRIPRLQDVHLPLGGPRFRPCLEDILQFLIEEFSIDREGDWQEAIETGRRTWRRFQTSAVVRDCPEEAARVLEDLGYLVKAPTPLPEESLKLNLY